LVEVTIDDIRRVGFNVYAIDSAKIALESIDSGYKVEKAFNRVFGDEAPSTGQVLPVASVSPVGVFANYSIISGY